MHAHTLFISHAHTVTRSSYLPVYFAFARFYRKRLRAPTRFSLRSRCAPLAFSRRSALPSLTFARFNADARSAVVTKSLAFRHARPPRLLEIKWTCAHAWRGKELSARGETLDKKGAESARSRARSNSFLSLS